MFHVNYNYDDGTIVYSKNPSLGNKVTIYSEIYLARLIPQLWVIVLIPYIPCLNEILPSEYSLPHQIVYFTKITYF